MYIDIIKAIATLLSRHPITVMRLNALEYQMLSSQ